MNHHSLLVGMQNGTTTMEVWWFLTELNKLLSYNAAITLLDVYKGVKLKSIQKHPHGDVYSSFIRNCQNLETTKLSLSR